jgi:hypothetical protein
VNLDARALFAPLVAVALLLVIGVQTSDALRKSGSWGQRRPAALPAEDLYTRLDHLLARSAEPTAPLPARNPFAYGGSARPAPVDRAHQPRRPGPVAETLQPRPRPLLTAIVADNDPRAVIRYEGRDFAVKAGDLFAEFRVVSISANEVVLDGGGQRLVLRPR